MSTDERPRAYSQVNILGEIQGDLSDLKSIEDGQRLRLARLDAS